MPGFSLGISMKTKLETTFEREIGLLIKFESNLDQIVELAFPERHQGDLKQMRLLKN